MLKNYIIIKKTSTDGTKISHIITIRSSTSYKLLFNPRLGLSLHYRCKKLLKKSKCPGINSYGIYCIDNKYNSEVCKGIFQSKANIQFNIEANIINFNFLQFKSKKMARHSYELDSMVLGL